MAADSNPIVPRDAVVLCIDDDAGVLAALRRLLRDEPYDVVTATTAGQALASLRVRPVEVVVADERMPQTSGCELLAEVRQRWPWIGRVILTAHPGHSVMIRAFEAGIDFLFHKPWDDHALKTTIRRLIREVERVRPRARAEESLEGDFDVGGEGG